MFFKASFSFVGAFAFGIASPAYRSLINLYIPKEHAGERATIMSIGSMGRNLIVLMLALPSSGKTGATTVSAWLLPALIILGAVLLANIVLRRDERE